MRTVVGLFDRFEDAQQVARGLIDAGIQRDKISLIANDSKGEYSKYIPGERGETAENVGSGAAAGAGIGATVGGLAGLLAGLGALAIPGIGPVIAAGPIAAALAGAGIGAAAGGLLGALTQMGIPEEHAKLYSEGVRHGGTLVLTSVDDMRTDQVVDIMNRFNPVDINERSQMWMHDRSTGHEEGDFEEREMQQRRYEQQNIPVTGDREEATFPMIEEDINIGKRRVDDMGDSDWMRYESMYRQDYQVRYGSTGRDFNYYMPAYRFGYDLRSNPTYAGYDWYRLEPEVRRDWERRGGQGAWEDIKDAVRHAWESFRRS